MYYGPLQRAYDEVGCPLIRREDTLDFFVDDGHAASGNVDVPATDEHDVGAGSVDVSVDASASDDREAGTVYTPMSSLRLASDCYA
eukprot:3934453-Rhodomonas_salina.1